MTVITPTVASTASLAQTLKSALGTVNTAAQSLSALTSGVAEVGFIFSTEMSTLRAKRAKDLELSLIEHEENAENNSMRRSAQSWAEHAQWMADATNRQAYLVIFARRNKITVEQAATQLGFKES